VPVTEVLEQTNVRRQPGPRVAHRRQLLASAVAVLLLGAVALLLTVGKSGSHRPAATATSSTSTTTTASATATTSGQPSKSPQSAPLGIQAADHVLAEYSSAYSAKNDRQLAALLAPNLVRRNGTNPAEDKAQAIATYRGQFSQLRGPRYMFSNVRVTPEPGGATVTATYTITSQNGTLKSPITLHLVAAPAGAQVDEITIPPRR
jgi:hypothetical protein